MWNIHVLQYRHVRHQHVYKTHALVKCFTLTDSYNKPLSMPAAKQQLKHLITINNTAYWSQSTFHTHVTVRVVTCATAAAGPADIGEEFCRWKTLECRCRRQRRRWDACMAPLALKTAESVHITSPPGLPIAKFDAISETFAAAFITHSRCSVAMLVQPLSEICRNFQAMLRVSGLLHSYISACHYATSAMVYRVPRRQPHHRSGLATLPSVGAVP